MDKTDHGQNGPPQDKTDHVKDKTDHILWQNGLCMGHTRPTRDIDMEILIFVEYEQTLRIT